MIKFKNKLLEANIVELSGYKDKTKICNIIYNWYDSIVFDMYVIQSERRKGYASLMYKNISTNGNWVTHYTDVDHPFFHRAFDGKFVKFPRIYFHMGDEPGYWMIEKKFIK